MNKIQRVTVIVVLVDVLLLVGYDVWAAYYGGAPATISWLLSWSSQQWWGASVVFAFGYLMGHFFAQNQRIHLNSKVLRKHP